MLLPEFKTGTYTLNASSLPFSFYANVFGSLTDVYYSNSGSAAGTVTITSIDTVNHLVSGSFQFTLVNPSDNSTKTVTSGIFSYVPYSGGSGNTTPTSGQHGYTEGQCRWQSVQSIPDYNQCLQRSARYCRNYHQMARRWPCLCRIT